MAAPEQSFALFERIKKSIVNDIESGKLKPNNEKPALPRRKDGLRREGLLARERDGDRIERVLATSPLAVGDVLPQLDDLARLHHADPVGDPPHHPEIMGDEQQA